MIKIRRALISVSDKTGLEGLIRVLYREGVEILSTGGTKKFIDSHNVPVKELSSYTDFSEILDGRVKTLHPKVFGGILYDRDVKEHCNTLTKMNIEPFDLVVVNLYPFEAVTSKDDVTQKDAIENIDIGGVALIRAAAKNSKDVTILSDIGQYGDFVKCFNKNDGKVTRELNTILAEKAFARTSFYDYLISSYFSNINEVHVEKKDEIPSALMTLRSKVEDLRYGENPHQKAALYKGSHCVKGSEPKQLHGKKLSYNNLIDIDAAFKLVNEFKGKTCAAIIKHTNPCGIALSKKSLSDAYVRARECDSKSFFGGIVAVNVEIDEMTAKLISESFLEAVIAPAFSKNAFEILSKKKNIRLIEFTSMNLVKGLIVRDTIFGTVAQDEDLQPDMKLEKMTTESDVEVDKETLAFAQIVCKHVKSNAIVLAKDMATVGIGAGQMSRIDALELAIKKSAGRVNDSVMASDAFFPFPDCVKVGAEHKIKAIVQPGGSMKDQDSIDEANKLGIPMYFTGMRHFKH